MKRKITILALGAIAVLLAVLILSGKSGMRRTLGDAQSQVVVTQNGRIVLVPPESHANFVVVADRPQSATNAPSAITNSASKR